MQRFLAKLEAVLESEELSPGLIDTVKRAAGSALQDLPAPDDATSGDGGGSGTNTGAAASRSQSVVPAAADVLGFEALDLQLRFAHDCQAKGCGDAACPLCERSPDRPCSRQLGRSYLVGDRLAARCGGLLRVELVCRPTGELYTGALPDGLCLELRVVEGALYEARFADQGAGLARASEADIEAISLPPAANGGALLALMGSRQPANFSCGGRGGVTTLDMQIMDGFATLPELRIIASGEQLLKGNGKKPQFRILVRARLRGCNDVSSTAADVSVAASASLINLRPAISEGFAVATARMKGDVKVELPLTTDEARVIIHLGKAACAKLKDLRAAAAELKRLLALAPANSVLRGQLQKLLVLGQDAWEEVVEHVGQAVEPDSRMRAWFEGTG
ncbi:hypothetical protein MNEG_2274 [Monoraphidium neglectum]|uniref:Uncharacterized protein n=1 Tax=Monoraphidium neglectum TaxID=145388 RepID=A0A0D2NM18_9CHLO|nr:hypothetical protein MNEG_2274 [Monoraphidium neglectum]KIZ05686.1 hypothetical protein MNEG_2274 [Monoraphidium neglectum]|eukprot:XP_013904705.1 hypothetical protein MNEG_2274 [Monoraphidium neglectum]